MKKGFWFDTILLIVAAILSVIILTLLHFDWDAYFRYKFPTK